MGRAKKATAADVTAAEGNGEAEAAAEETAPLSPYTHSLKGLRIEAANLPWDPEDLRDLLVRLLEAVEERTVG